MSTMKTLCCWGFVDTCSGVDLLLRILLINVQTDTKNETIHLLTLNETKMSVVLEAKVPRVNLEVYFEYRVKYSTSHLQIKSL